MIIKKITQVVRSTSILRVIPESEAKKVIKKYIREHPGCITSDIIENLNLDPALAVQALNLLEEEGKVRGEEVE